MHDMRKKLLLLSGVGVLLLGLYFFNPFQSAEYEVEGEEEEAESLEERFAQQFEQLKDPVTGDIPKDRLIFANEYTKASQRSAINNRIAALNWEERGPVYDFVGLSNGNSRGGAGGYTAGIVVTALVDMNADPTGNVVFAGSTTGGLWRCTNFLAAAAPNWQPVTDFSPNISVASICQHPASPNIMYLATGDGNTRDVRGFGIWKSTNSGLTWTLLPGSTGLNTAFKIICDNAGNVYVATYGSGLRRSTDGGTTWPAITPSGLTANASYVTDIELSSTGRLHASFGYLTSRVQHTFTDNPSTVTSADWTISTGIRKSTTTAHRLEMATQGNILYAVTVNSSLNIDSCYKSVDGGLSWTLQNTAIYTSALTNGQGYYDITLGINPDNTSEFIVGGVDAYRSFNDGVTIQRATYWVASAPYVHADHHFMQWYKVGTDSRILIGHDGGISQSYDGGINFVDRNQNLGIKQFYSCAISPTANENYFLGGTQDNGCHQLKNPGLSFSTEVTGGDGAFVHINQQNKQIQFGSYVNNRYRRSTDGGNSWSQVNFSDPSRPQFGGYFINPFDYDDATNIMYASNAIGSGNNQIIRWDNANTSGVTPLGASIYTIDELTRNFAGGNASSFKVSPYTSDRVYIGGNNGKLLRLNNASTVTAATINTEVTDVTGTSFPTAYLNCINTGTSDNTLVAVFTNYGISNVWYSTNGGSNWTAIDGTTGAGGLPDMPVWWAIFEPGSDSKLIIGTEAGVYSTSAVNGANTVWTAESNFPLVRVTQLKLRPSDNTIVASTYGRGIWTAVLGSCPLATISTQPASQSVCSGSNVTFSVDAVGTGLTYQWRKGGNNIATATGTSYTINNVTTADAGSYDVVVTNSCGNRTSSSAILVVNGPPSIGTQPAPQTVCAGTSASFSVAATGTGTLTYQWKKGGVNITGATSPNYAIASTIVADAGSYTVEITGPCGTVTSTPATLTVNTGGGCVTAVPNIDPDVTTLILMPNVVHENTVLRIKAQRPMNVNWSVVDAQGRVVMTFSQKLGSGQTDKSLQLGRLAAGIYYLQGTTEKGRLGTLRFEKL
jgi:hypothetical protein